MRICSKNSHILAFDYTLGSTGNNVTSVSEEKDMGVTINDKLSFDQHINKKINTANRVLGTTRRNFSYIGMDNFSQLYKAPVRPHLEFANQICAQHLKKHIEALENVQRRATKMLPELRNLSYPDHLCRLKLPTLAHCRLRGDMIELYKILPGKYDLDVSNNFIQLSDHNTNTRGHHLKTKKNRPRTNLRKNSFKLRTTDTWKNLPDQVVSAPNIDTFKNHLDKLWHTLPLLYDHNDSPEACDLSRSRYAHLDQQALLHNMSEIEPTEEADSMLYSCFSPNFDLSSTQPFCRQIVLKCGRKCTIVPIKALSM